MRAEVNCSWLHPDKQEVSGRTSSTSACRSLLLQRKATVRWLWRNPVWLDTEQNFSHISPAWFFSALGPLRQQHHAQFCQLHGSELQHPRFPIPIHVQKEEYKYPCTLLFVLACDQLLPAIRQVALLGQAKWIHSLSSPPIRYSGKFLKFHFSLYHVTIM